MTTANTKLNVANLDFDGIKYSLIEFMKTAKDENDMPIFTDYNFGASGLGVIIDTLAYNTHIQALMANFVANEMFLDTAAKRSSVVSHAKSLGYIPHSVTCSKIPITLVMEDPTPVGQDRPTTQIIPMGTQVISQVGNVRLTFVAVQNYVADWMPGYENGKYVVENVIFHEGVYTKNTVTYKTVTPYVAIPNTKCDTQTLRVFVREDIGGTEVEYQRVTSFLSLSESSTCYFIQESLNGGYEIYFGDGSFGYKPKDNSSVRMEYVVTNGFIGNNCVSMSMITNLPGTTKCVNQYDTNGDVISSSGGTDGETLSSIKTKAINHYGMQNRAVIASDYEALIVSGALTNVKDVRVWGGEDDSPPQYNAVVVCVEPQYGDYITSSDQELIKAIVRPKAVGNTNIIFRNPEYIDLIVDVLTTYNKNSISIGTYELEQKVKTAIFDYASTVSSFSGVFRSSNLIGILDNVDTSIISNQMTIKLAKFVRIILNKNNPIVFSYNNALSKDYYGATLQSGNFYISGYDSYVKFEDDRLGNINIVTADNSKIIHTNIGTINYETGNINIAPVYITSLSTFDLKFTAKPLEQDISTSRNYIVRVPTTQNTVSVKSRAA